METRQTWKTRQTSTFVRKSGSRRYITQYPIDGDNIVTKPKYQNGKVYINDTHILIMFQKNSQITGTTEFHNKKNDFNLFYDKSFDGSKDPWDMNLKRTEGCNKIFIRVDIINPFTVS